MNESLSPTRSARWSLLLGVGLGGILIGSWLNGGMTSRPDGLSIGWILAGSLLLVAAVVLWRRGKSPAKADVNKDPFTGLYRRAYAEEAMQGFMARDDRAEASGLALAMLTVDHAEEVRQRYGASGEQAVVRCIGSQILGQTRGGDLPARFSDEVVAVYLHCEDREQALGFGRRIRMLLRGQQIECQGDVIKASANIGIAQRQPGETLEALTERAVKALDQAARDRDGLIAA